jgi:pilus assembly protein CpaC
MIQIPAPIPAGEVLLQVKFAEVDRSAIEQFGFNFLSAAGSPLKMQGSTSTQQFASPQVQSSAGQVENQGFVFSDLLNVFLFRPDVQVGALIRALQQNNLLQILAEPNLLTQTGKEASFLAGGEFPFPVLQGTQSNAVTIQFKEFGVRLNFTPTLMEGGRIHLKVSPEVSALDFANALTVSGFVVPALSTRRVVTEMELGDGQSFAIAGLVDDRLTRSVAKIPWLGDIPILGKLFQSRSINRTKAELLVIVTPRVVKPSPIEPLPQQPQFPYPFMPPAAPEGSGATG